MKVGGENPAGSTTFFLLYTSYLRHSQSKLSLNFFWILSEAISYHYENSVVFIPDLTKVLASETISN